MVIVVVVATAHATSSFSSICQPLKKLIINECRNKLEGDEIIL
jgi:hypothetical protein